jgi:hypothetical protein
VAVIVNVPDADATISQLPLYAIGVTFSIRIIVVGGNTIEVLCVTVKVVGVDVIDNVGVVDVCPPIDIRLL